MKILITAIAIIAILLGASYFLNWLPWSQAPSAPLPSLPPNGGEPTPIPNPAPTPAPAPGLAPTPSQPPPPPSPDGSVVFGFAITDIGGSGFSRTITAQVTNNGSADAHNVWAEVEVFSGGSRIKLGGQDYLREDIGTLKAGEIVERQITISFSITDGLKISQNGAKFKLTLHSDEHTEAFSYDYAP